ncbi:MAG: 30S ribosomal protein S17 [Candidatus Curtissbacteria bacterium]
MAHAETGTVVSAKMLKTVVVKVQRKVKHPLYKKQVTKTKKFKAHDEIGVIVGQKVKILQVQPVSRDVHFKVMEVIK